MKKFRFQLDTLLELRKRKEEKIKLHLAEKNRQVMEAQIEINRIHDELKELQSSEKHRRGTNESITMLRYSVSYRFKLREDLLKAGQKMEDLRAEAVKVRKTLVTATKDRRAIEIVKERRLQEWKKENRTKEQGFIDDVSQQGFIRKTRSNKS
ncbi:MAG: flagellar export protein FliJ [Fibrobacter sp.]|nr:flagellar export protein FliJ [Fibrobacter sp.]